MKLDPYQSDDEQSELDFSDDYEVENGVASKSSFKDQYSQNAANAINHSTTSEPQLDRSLVRSSYSSPVRSPEQEPAREPQRFSIDSA